MDDDVDDNYDVGDDNMDNDDVDDDDDANFRLNLSDLVWTEHV